MMPEGIKTALLWLRLRGWPKRQSLPQQEEENQGLHSRLARQLH